MQQLGWLAMWALIVGAACSAPEERGRVGSAVGLPSAPDAIWRARFFEEQQTIEWLVGRSPPHLFDGLSSATVRARSLLARTPALLGGVDPVRELGEGRVSTDELGHLHIRFAEEVAGIPVWQGELQLHADADGALRLVVGRLARLVAPPLVPLLEKERAVRTARTLVADLAPRLAPDAVAVADGNLVLLPDAFRGQPAAHTARLAWRVEARRSDGGVPRGMALYIDARTGELLERESLIDELAGSGRGWHGEVRALEVEQDRGAYWLAMPSRGASATHTLAGRSRIPGPVVSSHDPRVWDDSGPGAGAAVDLHAHVARLWDLYASLFGWRGLDGQGAAVVAVAHVGEDWTGAAFDGSRLLFGDGDGRTFEPPAAAFDLVAHEYAHAVVHQAAGLSRRGESGALLEGVADSLACLTELLGESPVAAERAWQLGETVFHPRGLPSETGPLRDLARPWRTAQPSTLSERERLLGSRVDEAHWSASITGHAVYLMTTFGISPERTARVLFRAATRLLPSDAKWNDLADGMIAAAQDFGDAGAARAAHRAWATVGVAPTTPLQLPSAGPQPIDEDPPRESPGGAPVR